jgi:hypothetical protein
MSASGSNGDAPPVEWEAHADAIQRIRDAGDVDAIREALFMGLERDREAHVIRARAAREQEKFRISLFGDVAMILKGQARVESRLDVLDATLKVVGAKQAAGERDFQQLARETGGHRVSLTELERRQVAAERALAQNTSKFVVDRARLDERITWIDRRQDKLEGVVVETAKDAAVADDKAERALDSHHEIVDEKKQAREEQREVRKERREFKLRTWEKIVAVVATLVLLAAATLLGAKFGPQNVPHVPAPAPAH